MVKLRPRNRPSATTRRGDAGVPTSGDVHALRRLGILPRRFDRGRVQGAETVARDSASGRAVRARDAVYRRMLSIADLLAATATLLLAVVVLGGDIVSLALVAALPLAVLASKIIGLYDRDEHLIHKTTLDEAPALFQLATLYTLLIWLGEGVLVEEGLAGAGGGELGRDQVLGLWGLLFVSMLAARALARRLARVAVSDERCLILGGARAAEEIAKKLDASRSIRASVIGHVPLSAGDAPANGNAIGAFEDLGMVLAQHEVHRVIVAPGAADTEELLHAIRLVKSLGVKVSVLPRLFEVVGSAVRFDDVDGLTLLAVPRYGLTKSSETLKRGMDVAGSLVGLVLLAPLLLTIALAVKLTSSGPVFFRQTRVGRDGLEFEMYKFRTMVEGADEQKADLAELNEADGLFKIANDPRLTPVGRVLRRFSLDELPQLVNVLRGEMSLVGPRPLVADDDRLVEGWQRRRLVLRPGMTGVWQVLGSSRIPLREMVKVDYLYGANWSLWLDMKILLRTVPYVFARRGL
jgi:exopolysaccharide biosynthesis polyprenyl glycosylphosphotransferase